MCVRVTRPFRFFFRRGWPSRLHFEFCPPKMMDTVTTWARPSIKRQNKKLLPETPTKPQTGITVPGRPGNSKQRPPLVTSWCDTCPQPCLQPLAGFKMPVRGEIQFGGACMVQCVGWTGLLDSKYLQNLSYNHQKPFQSSSKAVPIIGGHQDI